MQEDVGLQSATDGEFRRASWHMDFIYQLGGVNKAHERHEGRSSATPRATIEFTPAAIHVDERISLEQPIFGDDFGFLQSVAGEGSTPKLTIPSPSMVHYRGGRAAIDESVYPDLEAFWADLSRAYADEVRALGELGCTYLQFDDTSLAYLNDPAQREQVARRGRRRRAPARDLHPQHQRGAGRTGPRAWRSPRTCAAATSAPPGSAEGSYDFVAEALFSELDVDGFFLEYDDERSGGFEPLRFVPEGKLVVLGLVTTKRGELESKDELKRRIDEASQYVPLDQLCLSPQCGFSSTVEGNALTQDEQVAKLRLVVETAAGGLGLGGSWGRPSEPL